MERDRIGFSIEGDLQGTMDKQKPTSGPWKAIPRKDCGVFCLYAGDEHLASLSFVDESTEDANANANLMADAPRMLEVLRNLHDFALPLRCISLAAESRLAFADALSLLEKHGG